MVFWNQVSRSVAVFVEGKVPWLDKVAMMPVHHFSFIVFCTRFSELHSRGPPIGIKRRNIKRF